MGQARPAVPGLGNTYYVGTCGISAILITSNPGAILIDGGTEKGADLIATNIEALGFKAAYVKALLMSHEHHDHVGGLAELQRLTGARLLVAVRAAEAMRTGKASVTDPQLDEGNTFPPVRVDGEVGDGDVVKLGDLELHAVATPGHTSGALSWWWESCAGGVCKRIVYADSLSPVSSDGYRFTDHPEYLAAFRASLARVAALRCDILLSPHPSASGMREKLLAGDLTAAPSCREYAEALGQRLDERLAQEADGE